MRDAFHEELDQISDKLVEMSRLTGSAMGRATIALLDADLELAESVIEADQAIDQMRRELDDTAVDLLARQQPVATDLRTVTAAMRIVADLERMGDLAVHVAKLARMRFPEHAVPQELRPIFLEAGHVAESLITKTATVIAKLDVEAAAALEAEDDLMDQLHRQLFNELLSKDWPHGMEAAIDITLLGRYYERFADHAVSVARRVVYLVTGEREMHATAD